LFGINSLQKNNKQKSFPQDVIFCSRARAGAFKGLATELKKGGLCGANAA
jgi:hypothetical protein